MRIMRLSDLQPQNFDQGDTANWPYKVDGICVHMSLHEFCRSVRARSPSLRFASHGNGNLNRENSNGLRVSIYDHVYVYLNGTDYVIGKLMHGTGWGAARSDKPQYVVESRKIENEKFKNTNDCYHRVYSADRIKGVKNALKYLVPATLHEIVQRSARGFHQQVQQVRSVAWQNREKVLDKLKDTNVLLREIRGLLDQGVTFATPEFQNAASEVVTLDATLKDLNNKTVNAWFVSIRIIGQRQYAEIMEVYESHLKNSQIESLQAKTLPLEELPEGAMGKLAMLMGVPVDHYIPDVGQRVTEKTYWIIRDDV